jgi:hypothetical protein
MRRQVFALPGVEHGVALHEGDEALNILSLIVGLGALDAIGINDQFAVLALALFDNRRFCGRNRLPGQTGSDILHISISKEVCHAGQ